MKILYFAWLKQKIGRGEEEFWIPHDQVKTAGQLIDWLIAKDGVYQEAFKDRDAVRIAIDQEYAQLSSSIEKAQEVAFFPPVTGG